MNNQILESLNNSLEINKNQTIDQQVKTVEKAIFKAQNGESEGVFYARNFNILNKGEKIIWGSIFEDNHTKRGNGQ